MTEDIVTTLRFLKTDLISHYKLRTIGLFGSFARNQQHPSSDVDLLVDFQDGADLFDLIGLSQFLEERLQRPVDVVPRRALREELRDAVLQEVIIL